MIDIDASDARIVDIYKGIIKPLKDEAESVSVRINIEAEGDLSEQLLKMKVKETLQQLKSKYTFEEVPASSKKIESFISTLVHKFSRDEKMLFETLAFIIGLVYGYVKPGKEKRWELFKKGIMYGIILGIFFGFIGLFIGGLLYSAATAIGMFITVIILVVIFIIGTFIGDVLEVAIKK